MSIPTSIKVLTLNLWHDAGPWEARQERIRDWIDRLDPDLIGFQEVLCGEARGQSVDQVASLLEGRAYHLDYVQASPFWRDAGALSFGNAIASRWPIVQRDALELPDRGDGETRAALTVRIDAPVGPLSLTTTHLNWKLHQSDTRCRQVVALAEHVLRLRPRDGFPPILIGDFNAEPDSDEMRFLRGGHAIADRSVYFNDAFRVAGDGPGHTWCNRNPYAREAFEPDKRIDYVYVGYPTREGLGQVLACGVVCDDEHEGVWPTDHFGVFAELRSDAVSATR
jgi:endonuclease/exonuclease/phosphatase family metal-dependent hydrolase